MWLCGKQHFVCLSWQFLRFVEKWAAIRQYVNVLKFHIKIIHRTAFHLKSFVSGCSYLNIFIKFAVEIFHMFFTNNKNYEILF